MLKKPKVWTCLWYSVFRFSQIFMKVAKCQDMHEISNEFETGVILYLLWSYVPLIHEIILYLTFSAGWVSTEQSLTIIGILIYFFANSSIWLVVMVTEMLKSRKISKINSSVVVWEIKLKLFRNIFSIGLYKNAVLIVVAQRYFLLLNHFGVCHWLINGVLKNIYCYFIVHILTKLLHKRSLDSS